MFAAQRLVRRSASAAQARPLQARPMALLWPVVVQQYVRRGWLSTTAAGEGGTPPYQLVVRMDIPEEKDSAPRLVKVALEPLTSEAFAPFGEICGTMAGGEPSLCVSPASQAPECALMIVPWAYGSQPRRGRYIDLAHAVRGRFSHQHPLYSLPRCPAALFVT